MKKNFAGQPAGGGQITILTGRDLLTEIPSSPSTSFFQSSPNFIDNCQPARNMRNFDDEIDWSGYGENDDYDAPVVTGATQKASTTPVPKSGSGFFSGINLGNLLQTGAQVYTTSQQAKTAKQQAELALQIERQKVAQELAKAKVEEEKAKGGAGKPQPKSYVIPIIVTGVVVIAGIGAYFYFKKKK